jgi:hypothetical protein
MIVSQETDLAGKIRIQWQSQATQNVYLYKFGSEPSLDRLQELSDASDAESEIQEVRQVDLSIHAERGTLIAFLEKVKATPNVTLAQYNTYLSSLHWTQAAVIRYFVFMMAQRLAERRDVNLANQNESTVLAAVRDFIVNTPPRKLARIIFNSNE